MKLSPMMEQYMAIKADYQDCILFFRLGDFYEMFYDDALLASKELELTPLRAKIAVRKKGLPCAESLSIPDELYCQAGRKRV